MQHSLEAYFLVNFMVDTALMATVARANECLKMRRVLLCSFLAASYALLTKTVSARLAHPMIQLMLLTPLGMLLCGDCEVRSWAFMVLQLFGGAMMLGGVGMLVPAQGPLQPVALGAGILLAGIVLRVRACRATNWEVTVMISAHGRTTSFRALIDTGNRLHEPLSGLPVLIAEEDLLGDVLDEQLTFRRIAYGGLGGSGAVQCFRPDMVLIRRGDQLVRAPEVWVAAYPGKFPGTSRALAPPSFAVIPGKT